MVDLTVVGMLIDVTVCINVNQAHWTIFLLQNDQFGRWGIGMNASCECWSIHGSTAQLHQYECSLCCNHTMCCVRITLTFNKYKIFVIKSSIMLTERAFDTWGSNLSFQVRHCNITYKWNYLKLIMISLVSNNNKNLCYCIKWSAVYILPMNDIHQSIL